MNEPSRDIATLDPQGTKKTTKSQKQNTENKKDEQHCRDQR